MIKEAIDPLQPEHVKLAFTSTANFWIGIFLLACLVIPGSLVGPLTLLLPSKSPLVKAIWRTQSNFVLGIPLLIGVYVMKRDEMDIRKDFSVQMLLNVAKASFFGFLWYISLVVGCSVTVTSHAMVMYCSTGVYFLFYALFTGKYVHMYELFGYALFFLGVFLMLTDPYAVKEEGSGNQYIGDLIPFLGAGAGAINGYLNSKNSTMVNPLVLMFQVFLCQTCYQLMFGSIVNGPLTFLSFDAHNGAFGWLTDFDVIISMLLIVGPFTGILGNVGLYASYNYFPMEIIASVILLQPFLSQVAGVLLGQDNIPGFRTVFGLIVITFGFMTASYGTRLKAFEEVAKI